MALIIKNQKGLILNHKDFLFPGGEVGLKLDATNYNFFHEITENVNGKYIIVANLHDSNDIMKVAMAKNALENIKSTDRNYRPIPFDLVIPYVPYARQDRVCDGGEAFSLKVFANFINSLGFSKVTVIDPHSDVTPALINNINVISQLDIIRKNELFHTRILQSGIFISPDVGANKKVSKLASYFDHREFVRADKLRDMATGEIKETIVYYDDFKGQDVIIPDDICDGGRTFLELAKVLKAKNAGKIVLYVSHMIASKGFKCLYEGGIDEIWTTNSFTKNFEGYLPGAPRLNIFDLNTVNFN